MMEKFCIRYSFLVILIFTVAAELYWNFLYGAILPHPKIKAVATDRFYNDMYADAIEAAMKEVNDRLKKIVKGIKGIEYDGAGQYTPNPPCLLIFFHLGGSASLIGCWFGVGYWE